MNNYLCHKFVEIGVCMCVATSHLGAVGTTFIDDVLDQTRRVGLGFVIITRSLGNTIATLLYVNVITLTRFALASKKAHGRKAGG